MYRINSTADALNSGAAQVDTGGGVVARIPLTPSSTPTILDTGLRNVSAQANGLVSGTVLLRRYGDVVRFNAYGATFSATNVNIYTLPVGFRPDSHTMLMQDIHTGQTGHSRVIVSMTNGSITPFGGVDNTAVYISLMWLTRDAPPTTIPGAAA